MPTHRTDLSRSARWKWIAAVVIGLGVLAALAARQLRPTPQTAAPVQQVAPALGKISCLGRIEPDFEVITLAAPSDGGTGTPLIAVLKIEEGDEIKAGQLIAELDNRRRLESAWQVATSRIGVAQQRLEQIKAGPKPADLAAQRTEISRLQLERDHAESEYRRTERLFRNGDIAKVELDARQLQWDTQQKLLKQAEERLASLAEVRKVDVNYAQAEIDAAIAEAKRAKSELDQAFVYSPITGRVVKIHARAGAQIGSNGIAEVAKTDRMFAVAEVYETDISRVKPGQLAEVSSDSFLEKLTGRIERVGLRTTKNSVLNADPASFSDKRVVEVKVLLDDPQKVAGLINARVTVTIKP